MSGLLIAYGASFSVIALLYYWARRNRRQGWRRHRPEGFQTDAPAIGRPRLLPAGRAVSVAAGLVALNQALETSVSPGKSPAPGAVHNKAQ